MTRRIGLIADTHGLLRPEARDFLNAADHIVHAGDIGDPRILDELLKVAPVSAVRGNNDRDPWTAVTARILDLSSARVLKCRTSIGSFNPLIWLPSPPHEQRG